MTDWLEHDGGPQPVANDVWVERPNSSRRIGPAHWFDWTVKGQFLILNQHLIDAARLEGIREGRDAAFRVLITQFLSQERSPPEWHILGTAISTLDPETVAKEAGPAYRRGDLDFLLGEEVEGYRAGAAASEARIKELEAALKDSVTAMRLLLDAVQKHNAESDTFLSGFPLHLLSIEIAAACALLKDGDQ